MAFQVLVPTVLGKRNIAFDFAARCVYLCGHGHAADREVCLGRERLGGREEGREREIAVQGSGP
eukprot:182671-Rhodomonas_salina.1